MPKKRKKKSDKDKAWDLLSLAIRKEKPECEICGNPTACVHHIVPRARGNIVYFLERNLLSLCAGCHMGWHRRWSPEEQNNATEKTKGDFDDVESVKWQMLKISKSDYVDMIKSYKERLNEKTI